MALTVGRPRRSWEGWWPGRTACWPGIRPGASVPRWCHRESSCRTSIAQIQPARANTKWRVNSVIREPPPRPGAHVYTYHKSTPSSPAPSPSPTTSTSINCLPRTHYKDITIYGSSMSTFKTIEQQARTMAQWHKYQWVVFFTIYYINSA